MVLSSVKSRLGSWLRRSAVWTAFLDHYPTSVEFLDGVHRQVTRRVARMFPRWNPTLYEDYEGRAAFAAYRGGDFVDVGAYQGWYGVVLAPKARPNDTFVLCEPDGRALPSLCSTASVLAKLFPHVRTHLVNAAVGDGGVARISFPCGEHGHPQILSAAVDGDSDDSAAAPSLPSSSSSSLAAAGSGTLTVDALVELLRLRPTFVKIDVEGAEFSVMRGMERTVRVHRPTVLLELHRQMLPEGVSETTVAAWFEERGYRRTDIDASHLLWKVV